MRFLISLILSACFIAIPAVQAAQYFEDSSSLLLDFSDAYQVKDYTEIHNDDQIATLLEVDKYIVIGPDLNQDSTGIFELMVSPINLHTVLDQIQLRIINTEKFSNRDLLGFTGIEIEGKSFEDDKTIKALLVDIGDSTLTIFYKGLDQPEYDYFLDSIRKIGGFSDIADHYLQAEILDVVEKGVFKGYVNQGEYSKEFRPDLGINRAEFTKVLVLANPNATKESIASFYSAYRPGLDRDMMEALNDSDDETRPLFHDVDRDVWYAPYLFYAYEHGWISGYPDGSFRPTDLVNVAEAIKVILESRAVELQSTSAVWFQPYLEYLLGKNILSTTGEGYNFSGKTNLFFPYEDCSRGMVAGFLSSL